MSRQESYMEVNLEYYRIPKGVRFTAEVLYSYIKRGYETFLQGEKKFREMLDLEQGEIRIGASDMTLQFYLLSYLEQFHMDYPNIKVTVTNAPTPETLKHLADGKIDFTYAIFLYIIRP